PTFVMYGIIAQSVGVEKIECKLDRNFDLNCDVIINKIKKLKPHLIFLSSPNNPTGNCFSTEKILKILDTAQKYSSLIVMDEAYQPFCSKKGFLSFIKDYKNLIILLKRFWEFQKQ
ncbi:MAG: aminotransferase class I/II-fold pyridoxal phosphate-dependent enzyme, partial [Candidatus Aenigmatarchaeota archaeon]